MNLDAYTDQQILKMKLRDLPISFEGSWLQVCAKTVEGMIASRNIDLKVNYWLSTEWFVPDGRCGIAIPFYLLHPRLIQLEKKYFGEAEGASYSEALKLFKHEMGHVIDNAFRLRRIKRRKEVFGDHEVEYPDRYEPNPESVNFVNHLGDNYAQAHPEEDWAETFAVWLGERSHWMSQYLDTPAIEKLCFMDYQMSKLIQKSQLLKNTSPVDDISSSDMTVRDYIKAKRKHLGLNRSVFTTELKKSLMRPSKAKNKLGTVLFEASDEIVLKVAKKTKQKQYRVKRMYSHLNKECAINGLLDMPVGKKSKKAIIDLMSKKSNAFFRGRHKVIM